MTWLEFISAIVASGAWPATALLLAVLLRKPLAESITTLKRVKYGKFEAEFGEKLDAIEAQLAREVVEEGAPVAQLPPGPADSEAVARINRLAVFSPRGAIVEAWREVESTAVAIAEKNGLRATPSTIAVWELLGNGLISARAAGLLNELRRLRNKAVHASEAEMTHATAQEYIEVANRAVHMLGRRARGQ